MIEHIEAVQRMQDYIQMNIEKEITMADLARASMYSPWYSYRLFVQFLDMTPALYIRSLVVIHTSILSVPDRFIFLNLMV